jgi:hypothetical protein
MKPTKATTLLRVQELDSLFLGPETVLTINSRVLRDTLPPIIYGSWGNSIIALPASPALPTDSVIIDITNKHDTLTLRSLGNINSVDISSGGLGVGIFGLCRTIKTPEGCLSRSCDTLNVLGDAVMPKLAHVQKPYPSPSKGSIALPTLQQPQAIFNAQGIQVWQGVLLSNCILDLSTWPRGLYIWRSGSNHARIVLE